MPFGEIFLKLSVTFPDDPKVRALIRYGVDGILARDLYVQMCLHCKRLLTDGFVADEQIGLLSYPLPPDHGNQLAKQLASVGLIKEASKDEAQGWQVLAYLRRNGTREDVERLSEVRAEAGRTGGLKGRKRPGQRTPKASSKQIANQAAQQNESNADSVSVSVEPDGSTEDRDSVAAQAPPSKRGTRIPDDFANTITAEMVAWAKEKCPHVDGRLETEKFVNYWQAKAGRDACKLDWEKTWKNWMLTAEEHAGRSSPGRGKQSSNVSHLDEWMCNRQ